MIREAADRLIVALDVPSAADALGFVDRLRPVVRTYKVGSQLFTAEGPRVIEAIRERGGRVFLDLKFHDIPKTVAGAAREAARLGAWMFNVHAAGGPAMMRAAKEAAAEAAGSGQPCPLVIGVTVLTSLGQADWDEVWGRSEALLDVALRLARLAQASGLDGIVASPHEVAAIRSACGPRFRTVVPGVRPPSGDADDQKRVKTPGEAIAAGADYIVVGRPILQAPDPADAAGRVIAEIQGAAEKAGG